MKLDTKVTKTTLFLLLLVVTPPFFSALHLPVLGKTLLDSVEFLQVLGLIFGGVLTLCWIKKNPLQQSTKIFWYWSVIWWLTLAGRSASWGRDYFPEEPHWLFRGISVVLIAALLVPLFFPMMRKVIAQQWKKSTLPIIPFVIAAVSFLCSDIVEHHRILSNVLLYDAAYQDITEELFENALILGLLYISVQMMRDEVGTRQA